MVDDDEASDFEHDQGPEGDGGLSDEIEELRDRIENLERGSAGRAGGIGVYGFGCALAISVSWSQHHSVIWAVLHGVLGWFYVGYFAYRSQ